jgi:hypothetical protein
MRLPEQLEIVVPEAPIIEQFKREDFGEQLTDAKRLRFLLVDDMVSNHFATKA